MRQGIWLLCLVALGMCSAGCATIVSGKYQEVPVTSEPNGVSFVTDTNESYVTPALLKLRRNKYCTLTATFEQAEPQVRELDHRVQGWFWGNIAAGGGIGMIVDAWTGACDKIVPEEVHFDFSEAGQAAAKRRQEYVDANPDIKRKFRCAVLNGIYVKKMEKEALIASLGEPDSIETDDKEVRLIYNRCEPSCYHFVKNRLVKVQTEEDPVADEGDPG